MLSSSDGAKAGSKAVRRLLFVAIILIAAASVAALIFSGSHHDPIVDVHGGALDATYCLTATPAVTSGAEFLQNQSSTPVTVTGVRAISASNARLVRTDIVPIALSDAYGTRTEAANAAVPTGLSAAEWAKRRSVPGAVIPPSKDAPTVKAWQLVFGVQVIQPGHRATLQQVLVTFHQGHHQYRFLSEVHDVIEATGVSDAGC
jgi:hypothetical protein